jgi:putative hemolysin
VEASQRVVRLQANREKKMRRSIGFIFLVMLAIGPERAWALANPASVFCVQSGGKSEIRNGARGQYGVCILPDGRAVEEWAYFRKMKGKAGNSPN